MSGELDSQVEAIMHYKLHWIKNHKTSQSRLEVCDSEASTFISTNNMKPNLTSTTRCIPTYTPISIPSTTLYIMKHNGVYPKFKVVQTVWPHEGNCVAVKVYHNKHSPCKTTQYSPVFSNNQTRPSNTHYQCINNTKFMCVFPTENAGTYSNKKHLLINTLLVSNIGDKTKRQPL